MPAAAPLTRPSVFRRLRYAALGGLAISLAAANTAEAAGLIRDAETETLIRIYAKPIFNAAGLASQAIHVQVVNDRAFNAFVNDGHYVFINAGALVDAKTPNQIIGVIAHECGHIAGGHLAGLRNQISRAKNTALMLQLLSFAAVAGAAVGSGNIPHVAIGGTHGGTDVAMRMVLAYRQDQESSADQAAVTFLNATKQSPRGLIEILQFMNDKQFGVRSPYLQSHPAPSQRLAQLRDLARESPYYENSDPPELQFRHDLVKAKLSGFLDAPRTVFNRYPQSDQSLAAKYARAIATYRVAGVRAALPQLDALILAKPDWPYFYEIEGRVLFESGKIDAAIPVLRQAVRLAPNKPLIQITLARAILATPGQRNIDEAISDLRTALAREPNSAMAYRQLAAAYVGKSDAAEGAARQQYLAQADLALAEAYFREGSLDLAKQQAKRAKAGFIYGTPNWLRADDIVMFEPTTNARSGWW